MRSNILIPLSREVTVLGQRYEALSLRTLRRHDLKAVAGVFKGEMGVKLAARLAGVPLTVIMALPDADAERVGAAVNAMLDRVL